MGPKVPSVLPSSAVTLLPPLLAAPAVACGLRAMALLAAASCASTGPATGSEEEIRLDRAGFATLSDQAPKVLVVVAHPDDELVATGALYLTGARLGGACDVLTITDGQGGFKYASFAEALHGVPLTQEEVGRRELPAIRREEQRRSLELLGARLLVRLQQTDHRYTQDRMEVLADDAGVWDLAAVRASLDRRLAEERYDFLVTLAPTATTHGHHQAASLLALEAVARMPETDRPVALCCQVKAADAEDLGVPPILVQAEADGQELTALRVMPNRPPTATAPFGRTPVPFTIDRNEPFGHRDRLTLKAIASVAIAQHLSQGTMLGYIGTGDLEEYWLFDLSPPSAAARAAGWFAQLQDPSFPQREYSASAGTNASR